MAGFLTWIRRLRLIPTFNELKGLNPPLPPPALTTRFRTAPTASTFQVGYEFLWRDHGRSYLMRVTESTPMPEPGIVEVTAQSIKELTPAVMLVQDPPEPPPPPLPHKWRTLDPTAGSRFCVQCRMFERNSKFNPEECPGEPEWYKKDRTR